MDFNGNWTFDSWGTASTPSYQTTGGNQGGFLDMTLFGTGARGFWMQPFRVAGSLPYTASVRLDLEIVGGLTSGRLLVSVDSSSSVPDPATAITVLTFSGPTAWTSTGRLSADARLASPGLYYLKIAFLVDSASGPVDVGFDNVRLAWTTDAAVVLYVPIPLPYPVIITQDKSLFLSYYGLITAAIFLIGGYYAFRERKEIWRAFKAPIESIGTRLRSRSAWIAVGQVWMAVTFFQVALISLLTLAGIEPTSPINLTPQNAWVLLFELANAGVYEEIIFRLLLIGLPMALGSVVLRIMDVNRGATGNGPGSAGRYIGGGWGDLVRGGPRGDPPQKNLPAGGALPFCRPPLLGVPRTAGGGALEVGPRPGAGLA